MATRYVTGLAAEGESKDQFWLGCESKQVECQYCYSISIGISFARHFNSTVCVDTTHYRSLHNVNSVAGLVSTVNVSDKDRYV